MLFKPMKREDVLKALEGHEDTITPVAKAHQEYFRKLSCVRCGGPVVAFVDPDRPFKQNEVLPNYLAKCTACECVFEPYTKIEIAIPKVYPFED